MKLLEPLDVMTRSSGGHVKKPFVGALLFAVLLYVGGFLIDQHLRLRRGPWEVTFRTDTTGQPELIIRQPHLHIRDARIRFRGQTVPSQATTMRFTDPRPSLPWGKVKYTDLTYLPGVATLDLFGHEIELLPRVLYVDRRAVPWDPEPDLELSPPPAPAPAVP